VIAIDALKRALLEALAVVGFAGLITCMVWLMLSPWDHRTVFVIALKFAR
jgi:hypothetical protein